MRISDWSSDVCSSDLFGIGHEHAYPFLLGFCYCEAFSQSSTIANAAHYNPDDTHSLCGRSKYARGAGSPLSRPLMLTRRETGRECIRGAPHLRSEEHTSELQSLMRISYAVFCLKKKKNKTKTTTKPPNYL